MLSSGRSRRTRRGLVVEGREPLPANFGQDPTNHVMLNAVKAAANEKDHAKRLKRLRETVDLDRFITLNALDVMMWNWDGYAWKKKRRRKAANAC